MAKRINGEGTIYFEKSRQKWRCIVTSPQGDQISKRFKDESSANAWRLEMLAKYAKGDFVARNDITVGEWIIQYLNIFAKPKVRAKTFDGYIDTASHISENFASKQLQKIKPFDVQLFLNSLDVSLHVQEKVGKLIRRVSKKAYALGVIEKDFTNGVEIAHPKKAVIEVFSVSELQKIFDTLDETPRLRHHSLLIALAMASGCRMGELLALTPRDITDTAIIINKALVESKGRIYTVAPKTEAGYRTVTLPSTIMGTLQYEASKYGQDDFIFKNAKGGPCRTSNIGKTWKVILKYANVPYRKFHCLRHTHATLLLAAGVPVNEVAKRLGHSRPSHTLNLYGHAIPGYDQNLPSLVTQIYKIGNNPVAKQSTSPNLPQFIPQVTPTLRPRQ